MWRKTLRIGNDSMPGYLNARWFVVYALLLGTILGGFRILQGGHFVSHQIWAMWWVVFCLMVLLELRIIKKRWLATL
jgi:membrane-associated PAP2 superfamily phosphatase